MLEQDDNYSTCHMPVQILFLYPIQSAIPLLYFPPWFHFNAQHIKAEDLCQLLLYQTPDYILEIGHCSLFKIHDRISLK